MRRKTDAEFRKAAAGTEVHDGGNLVLRVGAKRKAWVLVWRDGKRVQKVRLGDYAEMGVAEARQAAQDGMARVRQGLPPVPGLIAPKTRNAAPKPEPEALTVQRVLKTYMDRHVTLTAKDPDQVQWVVDTLLKPLHRKPTATLKRADITRFLDDTADTRGGPSAYRAGSVLRAAFRFGIRRGDIEADPTSLMSLPPGKARERVLSDAEIAAVWKTTVPTWSRLFRVLLLSGLRLREAAEAPATEITGDAWTIPAARMKGGRDHFVPVTPALARELGDLTDVRWLFKSPHRFDQPVKGFTRGLAAIQTAAGTADDWTWHDLRRTIASGLQRIGAPFEVIEAVLAHRRPGISAVYQRHEYINERRTWLRKWAATCDKR